MWCSRCQSDVAGTFSESENGLLCTICGTALSSDQQAPNPIDEQQQETRLKALHLLESWHNEAGEQTSIPLQEDSETSAEFETTVETTGPEFSDNNETYIGFTSSPPETPSTLSIYELQSSVMEKQAESQGGLLFLGHLATYSGIIGIVIGVSLIALYYLDGPVEFGPAGGLLVLCSQMTLFLGVVIQMNTRMRNSTRRITDRIDLIGNRVTRIEQQLQREQTQLSSDTNDQSASRPAA